MFSARRGRVYRAHGASGSAIQSVRAIARFGLGRELQYASMAVYEHQTGRFDRFLVPHWSGLSIRVGVLQQKIKRRRLYSPRNELVPLSGIQRFIMLLVGLDALYMGLKLLVCQ